MYNATEVDNRWSEAILVLEKQSVSTAYIFSLEKKVNFTS